MGTSPLVINRSFACPRCGHRVPLNTHGRLWTANSPHAVAEHLTLQMSDLPVEVIDVLSLSAANRVIDHSRIVVGAITEASVSVAEIVRLPILHRAPGCLVVHPHPGQSEAFSPQDINLAAAILAACRLHSIDLLDFVVIAGGSYRSMRDQGLITFSR